MSTPPSPTPPDDVVFVCACEWWKRRDSCRERFYKEHDGKLYCVLHYPGIEKKEDFKKALRRKLDAKDFDFQGVWFPDRASFQGFTFTKAADFRYAQFTDYADFVFAQFTKDASFFRAQFTEAAYFWNAQFTEDANFSEAQFTKAAYFSDAKFRERAEFDSAVFNQTVSFKQTRFIADDSSGGQDIISFIADDNSGGQDIISNNEATGTGAAVGAIAKTIRVTFRGATFKESVTFEKNVFAERCFISFDAAIFEKPERATFHTTPLRPHWFINIDSRKFTFIGVNWGLLDKRDAIRREIAALESSEHGELSRLLDITFRQLAVNAEENNRYEEAANFRYMAMEAKRLQRARKRQRRQSRIIRRVIQLLHSWRHWLRRQKRLWRIIKRVNLKTRRVIRRFNLRWWYWLLSGYGERVTRAFGVLITIWLLFAVIYWTGNASWWQPKQSAKLAAEMSTREQPSPAVKDMPQPAALAAVPFTMPEAITYSAYVAALQKPEPLPAWWAIKALVLFEMILGPLQAALLALAIRRKFMR